MKNLIQHTIYIFITAILLIGPNPLSSQSIGLHVDPALNVLFGDSLAGDGNKLLWLPGQGAFRAGDPDGDLWDVDTIGLHSAAFGRSTLASGLESMAWGLNNHAVGRYATSFGNGARALGAGATAFGGSTQAIGLQSTAFGQNNYAYGNASTTWGGGPSIEFVNDMLIFTPIQNNAKGNFSTVWGTRNIATSYNETILGRFADTTQTNDPQVWDESHQLFAIGNGQDEDNRNNALTVLKNGNTEISAFTKLGSDAPSIKVKKVVGTTPAAEGGVISFPHGIAEEEKIISATAVIRYNIFANDSVIIPPGGNTGIIETTYGFRIQGALAIVQLSPSDSSNIVNREVVITITYEE